MTRELAWERLKTLTRARLILRAWGATVGTVRERDLVDRHIKKVADRLRAKCRPIAVDTNPHT